MKTLELKEIAGYLPHGLKFKYFDPKRECEEIIQLGEVLIEDWEDYSSRYYNGMNYYYLLPGDALPILRPLSDLYRPITHNGKEIVPIVECAKASMPDSEWEAGDNYAITDIFDNGECMLKFRYSRTLGTFLIGSDAPQNQYMIFDCLHELKIDYRGLIDAGLCVSCYDLEKNPYM